MKFSSIAYSIAVIVSLAQATELVCYDEDVKYYKDEVVFTDQLQNMIDQASASEQPVVYLEPGIFIMDPARPIVLKEGVSLRGYSGQPTILAVQDKNTTASIEVQKENLAWSIQDIVFENVNVVVNSSTHEDESAVLSNVFMNGGRGSVISEYGRRLHINGNIFLRDEAHVATQRNPTYDTTNSGILFQTQKNSVVSNNIFGMDLRAINSLDPVISQQLEKPLKNLKFIHQCLGRNLADEQGYLSSGVQLYASNDITIKENILNATFPDTKYIAQDHAISVVGSNQTYVYQNFFAGWQIGDFGGAVRFTSAVDGYFISNYLANMGLMMYAAAHADYLQVSNMIVHKNFFYHFLGEDVAPVPEEQRGWLYDGVTFFDFYTARFNNTIRPPIWNSSVPISPWGWHIVVSENKFGASEGLDPYLISMGNLDEREAHIDKKNCFVTEPLVPGSRDAYIVPIIWRESFEEGLFTKNQGKIPKKLIKHTDEDLQDQVPAHLRNLHIPSYWKAFTLKNNTMSMISPHLPCSY